MKSLLKLAHWLILLLALVPDKAFALDKCLEIFPSATSTFSQNGNKKLSLPNFEKTNSNDHRDLAKNSTHSLTAGEYGNIKLLQGAVLNLLDEGKKYIMRELIIEKNSTVNIAGGDFFIEKIIFGQGSALNVIGNKTVRLYANSDFKFEKNASINSSNGDLIAISYNNLEVLQGAGVNGVLYASSLIKFEKNTVLNGASTTQNLNKDSKASTIYNADNITDADFETIDGHVMCDNGAAQESYELRVSDGNNLEGKPITFEIGLYDSNDDLVSASENISFYFNTQDVTAIEANGDYDGYNNLELTLPLGSSTIEVIANTYYSQQANELTFTGSVSKIDPLDYEDITIDHSGTGTIRQFAYVLADYHLDECEFTGQANDVEDFSGNNRHGSSQNALLKDDNGQVKTAASFDTISSFPEISTSIPLSGSWSISTWVKLENDFSFDPKPLFANSNNNAHFRLVTDLWAWPSSNLAWSIGGFSLFDTRTKSLDFIMDNAWHHLVVIGDNSSNTTKLYVDGVFYDQVSGYVSSSLNKIGQETLTPFFWQVSYGYGNRLDEVVVFNDAISEEEITTIYQNQRVDKEFYGEDRAEPSCGGDVYYQLVHETQGLTCEPEQVAIMTCTDNGCTSSGNDTLVFKVYDDNQEVVSESINLANSNLVSYRFTEERDVRISLASGDGTDLAPECLDDMAGNSCITSFSNAGFKFTNALPLGESYISGDDFELTIQAVKDDNGVCIPSIVGGRNIDFAVEYVSPAQTTANSYIVTTDGPITIPAAVGSTAGASVPVTFDGNGEADFDNVYYDAGDITLHLSYVDDEGAQIQGSALFKVRPARFIVEATSEDGETLHDATLTIDNANTQRAGADFNLVVKAVNSDGGTTTNYQTQQIEINSTMVSPTVASGGSNGDLTFPQGIIKATGIGYHPVSSDSSLFINGEMAYDQASFTEVGYIGLEVRDTNYTTNATISTDAAVTIGRFTPYNLVQHLEADGGVEHGQLGYSSGQAYAYVGAEFGYSDTPKLGFKAVNEQKGITKNYSGAFMRLLPAGVDINLPVADESKTNKAGDLMPLANVNLGNGTITELDPGEIEYRFNPNDDFTYQRDADSAVTPFNGSILLELASVTDADGVLAVHYDDQDQLSTLLSPRVQGASDFMRFGRVRLENSYGLESATQRIPAVVEFLSDSGRFITNTLDDQTILDISSSANYTITTSLSNINLSCPAEGAAPDNTSCPQYNSCSSSSTYIDGINRTMTLQKCDEDRGQLTFELVVPDWLKFNWSDEAGEPTENPTATATFGQYRGNDRVIYRRELTGGN